MFERLILTLDKDENGLVSVEVLLLALSMVVESSVEDRVEGLFNAFTSLQDKSLEDSRAKISEESLVLFVDSLLQTCQLPIKVLTREYSKFPYVEFKTYKRVSAQHIVGKAIKETIAVRTKAKTLKGYELDLEPQMNTVQALETDKDPIHPLIVSPNQTPTWDLEDFKDIVKSRALCAWGECYNKSAH